MNFNVDYEDDILTLTVNGVMVNVEENEKQTELYISLSDNEVDESEELDGIVIDRDIDGNIVGVELIKHED